MAENPVHTILVIDDEQFILELLVAWLSAAGFQVIPALSGEEGLLLFRSQPFDLVLTDLAMSNVDGLQVLATINREDPDLPVIIISGAGNLEDSIKAMRLGAWDYLSKPIDPGLLNHRINKALERAALLKENIRHRQHLEAEVERRTAQLRQRSDELEQANLLLEEEIQTRQETERKLHEANDRWQTTFDSMTDFVSIHDEEYTILQANQSLAQFLDTTPEELIGKKCYDVFHGRCTPWPTCPHRTLMATGLSQTCEIIDPRLTLPLLVTVSPIKNKGRIIGSVHAAKDISRQKKLEEERQKNINLEAIAVLCGGLAHDFNNLLTALSGYIELAKMEGATDRLPHWLNHAKMITNLAAGLTKQLLTFSKGGTPIFSHVPVAGLIQDSLEQCQANFPQVRPALDLAPDLWPINGDHGQLCTVIKNIFYNAAESMPNGGTLKIEARNTPKRQGPSADEPPRPAPEVGSVQSPSAGDSDQSPLAGDSVQSPLAGDAVRLSFTDQGGGISPEILSKIFDPYFTTSAKGAVKGKGLGLALCHSIISKHHGHIDVSSKKAQGTTVTIHLPAATLPAPATHGFRLTTDDTSG